MNDQNSSDARDGGGKSRATRSPLTGIDSTSRRGFLATGVALSGAALAGCLGGEETESSGQSTTGGTAGTTGSGEPQTPWTTEALADHIDDGKTLTIYAGTGDSQQWYDLIEVVNDEFGTSIEGNVFASDGATVSQRFIQERRAGEDKADFITTASNLRDKIKTEGNDAGLELARDWFEWDLDQNFWFTDELPEKRVMSFQVSAFNGGAGICMPISEQVFEERGLDYPETYNDLFEDQYEGLDVAFSGYVSPEQVGWITRYHAAQTDMDPMEWITTLMDHLNVVGVDSHSAGTREVGKGNAAMMLYNWPWAAGPFVKDENLRVRGHFTSPVKADAMEGQVSLNKNAPNPWLARFFLSAMLEKSVQRRMLTDVTDQVPMRTDMDLSGVDIHPFTKKRLNAELFTIGFWEGAEFAETGQKAVDKGIFKP